jgi:hypothetical protein
MLGIPEPNVAEGFQVVSHPSADSLLLSNPLDMSSLVRLSPTRPHLQLPPTPSNDVIRYDHNGSKSYDFNMVSSFVNLFTDIGNSFDNLPPFYPSFSFLASDAAPTHHAYLELLSPLQGRIRQVSDSLESQMWRKHIMYSAPSETLDLELCRMSQSSPSNVQFQHSSSFSLSKTLYIRNSCDAFLLDDGRKAFCSDNRYASLRGHAY